MKNGTNKARLLSSRFTQVVGFAAESTLVLGLLPCSGMGSSRLSANSIQDEPKNVPFVLSVHAQGSSKGFFEEDLDLWLGVLNQRETPRVICLNGSSYRAYAGDDHPTRVADVWPRSSHTCSSWSRSRHLVLPGETLFEKAKLRTRDIEPSAEKVRLSVAVLELGAVDTPIETPLSYVSSVVYEGGKVVASRMPVLLDEVGDLTSSEPKWSLSVVPAFAEPGTAGGLWVGVRNDSERADIISWPAVSLELRSANDTIEIDAEELTFETNGRSQFLILPGQTFYSLRRLPTQSRRFPLPESVTVLVEIQEVIDQGADVRLGKPIALEWSGRPFGSPD